MSTDQQIEQEIQAKGPTAPRITPADIEASIASEHYFTAKDGAEGAHLRNSPHFNGTPVPDGLNLLTFCVLVLRNGTKIVGINYGPVSPENFDAKMARDEARKNALEQIWPLLGYELRTRLRGMKGPLTAGSDGA